MSRLLIISGPTATGKTKLALSLAKLFDGELISADSRQVYTGMDIGTGKETDPAVKTWGYNLVSPHEEWSTAHFAQYANRVIADIQQRKKLPIIIGGTGLYIKNLLYPPETLFIVQNKNLREKLEKMTVSELQVKLQLVDKKRFELMNESDKRNPRRLVRAIEIQSLKGRSLPTTRTVLNTTADVFHIALTAPLEMLDKRIEERVRERLNQGVEKEVRGLVEKYSWNSALSHTMGYQEWKLYLDGKKIKEEIVALWKTHEKQYARRQLTWFRKQSGLQWFDITDQDHPKTVVSFVRQWYDGLQDVRT